MHTPTRYFVQHLLEMVVAMFAGMLVLGMPLGALFDALGWQVMNEAVVPNTMVMATTMTIGMSAWMLFRGCSWPAIWQMALAMYVPFVVMYPFYFGGLASASAVMMVGHVLMIPAMVVAMLIRRDEYTHPHSHHRKAAKQEPALANS